VKFQTLRRPENRLPPITPSSLSAPSGNPRTDTVASQEPNKK